MTRDFVVFVVRFQGCLWRGPLSRYLHMSLSYVMAREFFNFFVGALGYGSVLVGLIARCRIRCGHIPFRASYLRDCALVSGLSGLEGLAPRVPSWVPHTLRASSWLCDCSGVVGAGQTSPCPFLGAGHVLGILVTVLGFEGPQAAKARLFASSLCLWVSSFSEWCLLFSR